ncbi:MAG: hypothetical protein E7013_05275 [Alphaproteobacteria bacterium]|nr:hypothetical protein [Alphaproteobacteria bacterium]
MSSSFYPNGTIEREYFNEPRDSVRERYYNECGLLEEERLTSGLICHYDENGKVISRTLKKNGKEYDFLKNGAQELVEDHKRLKKAERKERLEVRRKILKALKKGDRATAMQILKDFHQTGKYRTTALN